MTETARALIVGCGRIAGGFNEADESAVLTHVVAYRRAGVSVAGCVDRDREAAARFAARWGIAEWGDDLAAVLERARPDVASLCTPPAARLEPLRALLSAPSVRAVLVEKPLAATVAEAEAVAALARSRGRPLLVNYFRAFDPFYMEIERAGRAREWGPLRLGTALYYGDAATNASHLVERLLAMFGAPSACRRIGGEDGRPAFEMQWGEARVTFLPAAGCRYSPIEMDLLFEDGRLRVVDSERRAERFEARPDPDYPGFFTLAPAALAEPSRPSPQSILAAVQAALRAAERGPHAADGELLRRAVDVLRVLEGVEPR